mmetsp:Transcript_7399/g.8924  ORF Transcript_7399/g.8924 Transcript_7399/m.8924 type:complete len:181 (-) Transcript_7399:1370-1912(-)
MFKAGNVKKILSASKYVAERKLSRELGYTHKLVFWLTNLPYWICFYQSLDLERKIGSESGVCGNYLAFSLSMLSVAFASTLMHSAQLRLFSCNDSVEHKFYSQSTQRQLKRLDIGCALWMIVFFSICKGLEQVLPIALLVLPFFITGAILKRTERYHLYTVVHGLWHIFSAFSGWYLLTV